MEQLEPDPLVNAIGGTLGIIGALMERANIATLDEFAAALATYGAVTNETDRAEAAIIAQWVVALHDVGAKLPSGN